MFDQVDGFTRNYNGTTYLALCGSEKYNTSFSGITYLIRPKSGTPYVVSHNYGKIKIDSDNDLPLEKTFSLHNAAILIKPVFHKNKNQQYYNVF